MKFHKLFLVSILLLAIFSLGSVSAVSDENINSDLLTESGDLGEIMDAPNEYLIDSSPEDSDLNSAADENVQSSDLEVIGEEDQSNGKTLSTELADEMDAETESDSFDDLFTLDFPEKIYLWGDDNDYYGVQINFDPDLRGNMTFILNGNIISTSDLNGTSSPGMIYVVDWFSKIGQNNCTLIFENGTVSLEKTDHRMQKEIWLH